MVQNDRKYFAFSRFGCSTLRVPLYYLADVGIEVHHTVTELLHVLSYQLVGVGDTVVQVANLIVCEPPVVRFSVVADIIKTVASKSSTRT